MMWFTRKKDTHDPVLLNLQQLVRHEKYFFSDGCAWTSAATNDKCLHMNLMKNELFVVEQVSPPLAGMVCQTHRIRLSIKEKTLTGTRLVAAIVEGPAVFEPSTLAGNWG